MLHAKSLSHRQGVRMKTNGRRFVSQFMTRDAGLLFGKNIRLFRKNS